MNTFLPMDETGDILTGKLIGLVMGSRKKEGEKRVKKQDKASVPSWEGEDEDE